MCRCLCIVHDLNCWASVHVLHVLPAGHSIVITQSGDVYTWGAQQDGELCRRGAGAGKFVPPGIIDGPRGMYKDACSSEVWWRASKACHCVPWIAPRPDSPK